MGGAVDPPACYPVSQSALYCTLHDWNKITRIQKLNIDLRQEFLKSPDVSVYRLLHDPNDQGQAVKPFKPLVNIYWST